MASTARPLQRSPDRVVAGVAAGLAARLGVDAIWVRVAFVLTTLTGGLGVPLYALGWLAMPRAHGAIARRLPTGRGAMEVGAGAGLLVLAALLTVRASGVAWFSDALTWPLVLVAAGGALIWRTSQGAGGDGPAVPARPRDVAAPAPEPEPAERAARAASAVSRTGLGVVLVLAAAAVFLQTTGSLGAVRDVLLVALVVALALAVILGPWFLRLARSLTAERSARIRSQERAEVAAHLHDSVLQTLALVQKRADDPREVAALARSQERELRAWLSGRGEEEGRLRLRAALEGAAAEVERAHGVPVEVVAVGDRDLDERAQALVAAAREAMVNAAKHAGDAAGPISVYAETTGDGAEVYVRDRGQGFAPEDVPADRRGIAESIVGRMARHGGRAAVHSTPGGGTEVELRL